MSVLAADAPANTVASGYRAGDHATGAPRAVLLVEPHEVKLGTSQSGDMVIDTWQGAHVVEEIVHRNWDPAWMFSSANGYTRVHNGPDMLRVARSVTESRTVAGHTYQVAAAKPPGRSGLSDADGYAVTCVCGWPGERNAVHLTSSLARRTWEAHKADVISLRSCGDHIGCQVITQAESQARLPPVAWSFAQSGIALARIDHFNLADARRVARAWAAAFGVHAEEQHVRQGTVLSVRADSRAGSQPKLPAVILQGIILNEAKA